MDSTVSEDTVTGGERIFFFGKVKVNVHCASFHAEQTILLCTNIKILFSASSENPLQAKPP